MHNILIIFGFEIGCCVIELINLILGSSWRQTEGPQPALYESLRFSTLSLKRLSLKIFDNIVLKQHYINL